MNQIREVLRLGIEQKYSVRQIETALGRKVSRKAAGSYLNRLKISGMKYSDILSMSDEDLLQIFETQKSLFACPRYQRLSEKFPYFVMELKKTGVTLELLWQEYRVENSDGYQYSQFCYHFNEWEKSIKVDMHMEHKAGDKTFADYTGDKLKITDRITEEETEVEVFVALLGASQLTYAEATMTQQQPDFFPANENAYRYFGGVTAATVVDCFRPAVTKGDKYDPEVNPHYSDFGCHYKTVILPARPYHPKDKALVEGAVKIIYTRVFAPLRNSVFYSLDDLNSAIREKLEIHNNMLMQHLKISRRELFERTEKHLLQPLPSQRYQFKNIRKVKVQFNYHVYLKEDEHYYSVPFRYKGHEITLKYTSDTVEIFHSHIRIASYKRDRTWNKYTTLKEHMTKAHQHIADWTPERFISWASSIGDSVRIVIEKTLSESPHPEQAFKLCMGILAMATEFGNSRLNTGCRKGLSFGNYSLKAIGVILKNKIDQIPDEPELPLTLPIHENIRGMNEYN